MEYANIEKQFLAIIEYYMKGPTGSFEMSIPLLCSRLGIEKERELITAINSMHIPGYNINMNETKVIITRR